MLWLFIIFFLFAKEKRDKMKTILASAGKIILILVLVAVFVVVANKVADVAEARNGVTKHAAAAAKKHKKVTFGSHVQVRNISGGRDERYNPDLQACVRRNSALAQSVGGYKKLAQLSLAEAS